MHYLLKTEECLKFSASNTFKKQFDDKLQNDREMYDEPFGWQTKSISESSLLSDFSQI